jgi:hypothetical protein
LQRSRADTLHFERRHQRTSNSAARSSGPLTRGRAGATPAPPRERSTVAQQGQRHEPSQLRAILRGTNLRRSKASTRSLSATTRSLGKNATRFSSTLFKQKSHRNLPRHEPLQPARTAPEPPKARIDTTSSHSKASSDTNHRLRRITLNQTVNNQPNRQQHEPPRRTKAIGTSTGLAIPSTPRKAPPRESGREKGSLVAATAPTRSLTTGSRRKQAGTKDCWPPPPRQPGP